MQLIAIYHNCFIIQTPDLTMLFDFPRSDFLPAECRDVVLRTLSGKKCIAFASHSHPDHFDPCLAEILNHADKALWIVSDDIADMHPDALPNDAVIMEPGQQFHCADCDVSTLESNDLGVAFCINVGGIRIYHGGDLAKWRWPDASPTVERAVRIFWNNALNSIADFAPHLAFSNADNRVADFSGALDFVRTVKPKVFVPMHTFGNASWINEFQVTLGETPTRIFSYSACADSLTLNTSTLHS